MPEGSGGGTPAVEGTGRSIAPTMPGRRGTAASPVSGERCSSRCPGRSIPSPTPRRAIGSAGAGGRRRPGRAVVRRRARLRNMVSSESAQTTGSRGPSRDGIAVVSPELEPGDDLVVGDVGEVEVDRGRSRRAGSPWRARRRSITSRRVRRAAVKTASVVDASGGSAEHPDRSSSSRPLAACDAAKTTLARRIPRPAAAAHQLLDGQVVEVVRGDLGGHLGGERSRLRILEAAGDLSEHRRGGRRTGVCDEVPSVLSFQSNPSGRSGERHRRQTRQPVVQPGRPSRGRGGVEGLVGGQHGEDAQRVASGRGSSTSAASRRPAATELGERRRRHPCGIGERAERAAAECPVRTPGAVPRRSPAGPSDSQVATRGVGIVEAGRVVTGLPGLAEVVPRAGAEPHAAEFDVEHDPQPGRRVRIAEADPVHRRGRAVDHVREGRHGRPPRQDEGADVGGDLARPRPPEVAEDAERRAPRSPRRAPDRARRSSRTGARHWWVVSCMIAVGCARLCRVILIAATGETPPRSQSLIPALSTAAPSPLSG